MQVFMQSQDNLTADCVNTYTYDCIPLGLMTVLHSFLLLKSQTSTKSSLRRVWYCVPLSYCIVCLSCCCNTLSLMLGSTKSRCKHGLRFSNSSTGATPVVV